MNQPFGNPREALDAIHDEAFKLLRMTTLEEIHQGLHLIISLARYGFDVRSADEIDAAKTELEDS